MTRALLSLLAAFLSGSVHSRPVFDHTHAEWGKVLQQFVVMEDHGRASKVRYAALAADTTLLDRYLAGVAGVRLDEYTRWTKPEQLAFLINAYNAFTVRLVLDHYPDIRSIRDIGGWFRSPWKMKFFTLLGARHSLDDIEHGMIRAPGRFDDPRIHFAIVCASVSCPMLRPEPYVAARLDRQLDDALCRFLGRRSEHRIDPASGRFVVSSIFKWYADDFSAGSRRLGGSDGIFATHAACAGDDPASQERLRRGDFTLAYGAYDWRLNDVRTD